MADVPQGLISQINKSECGSSLGERNPRLFCCPDERKKAVIKSVQRITCDECGNNFHPKELFCKTCHAFEGLNKVKWLPKRNIKNESNKFGELLKNIEVQN
jgi:hypothetical protein